MEISGVYKISVIRGDKTIFNSEHKNIITDEGYRFIHENTTLSGIFVSFHVGSSNVPPSSTDTALFSEVGNQVQAVSASTPTLISGIDGFGEWFGVSFQCAFPLGAIDATIRELGFRFSMSNTVDSPLNSRALAQDYNGGETQIVVTDEDQLFVSYELRTYKTQLQPNSGQIEINGSTYTWESLPACNRVVDYHQPNDTLFFMAPVISQDSPLVVSDVAGLGGSGSPITGSLTNITAVQGYGTFWDPAQDTVRTNLVLQPAVANLAGGLKRLALPNGNLSKARQLIKYEFTPPIPKTDSMYLYLRLLYGAVSL